MQAATLLIDEAPLTWRTLPLWVLFAAAFVVVSVVGGVLVATMNLLQARAPVFAQSGPDAARRLPALSAVNS
ncbi:MAG TPA: hypothetical protein VGL58_09180 [Caulobacteraceae bacterium]|jgi:predicted membrane-bound dolichyl-phosphate-mannose-protein mannosyltransferase